jgi:hypothetical protein
MYVCVYVHVCMYVCTYVCMRVCMYVRMCVWMYVYITCIYIYIYSVCVCVCVCVCFPTVTQISYGHTPPGACLKLCHLSPTNRLPNTNYPIVYYMQLTNWSINQPHTRWPKVGVCLSFVHRTAS